MAHLITLKFGGRSVRNAEWLRNSAAIVHLDDRRKVVVVSAPEGITELLIAWVTPYDQEFIRAETAKIHAQYADKDAIFAAIRDRFVGIVTELGLDLDIGSLINAMPEEYERIIETGMDDDGYHFVVSRGENWNGRIMAKLLGYTFVDPIDFIVVDGNGVYKPKATEALAKKFKLAEKAFDGIVVAGFYGRASWGKKRPRTLTRGGSDTTNSILGKTLGKDIVICAEFWKEDVPGVMTANPKVVPNALKIDEMIFDEIFELGDGGAKVFNPDAVRPLAEAGIPVNVRCTGTPKAEGTWILPWVPSIAGTITAIAHSDGFTHLKLKKIGIATERGFDMRVDRVLYRFGVNIDHKQMGTHRMTLVVPTADLNGRRDSIIRALQKTCGVEEKNIAFVDGYSVVRTVGRGMADAVGVAARLFGAIARENVSAATIDQDASQTTVAVSVLAEHAVRTVAAIHSTFIA